MLITVNRSEFLRRVELKAASVQNKSNMLNEIFNEMFSTLFVRMQAIRFVEVMSGPKTKWLTKSCPVAMQEVF